MRALRKNKQTMYYSLFGEQTPIYAKDSDGNIIYDTMRDGTLKPRKTGSMTNGYEEPVKFEGNIAAAGGAAEAEAYGVDLSSYEAVLYAVKGELPIDETSLIWYEDEPIMKDGQVDEKSADYRVIRVPPCLNESVYLLAGITK